MGNIRFGAPQELLLWIRDTIGAKTFVETGTNKAATAVWASEHFARVFTVEAFDPLYRAAVQNYGSRKNIQFLNGDSRTHIPPVIESLTEPAIFWLDAHWCGEQTFGKTDECPVIGELEALNSSKIPHAILIDDARFFIAPPPANHDATHWPDIGRICELLRANRFDLYIAIHEDVIIAMPSEWKAATIAYLRERIQESLKRSQSGGRALVRRLLAKVRSRP